MNPTISPRARAAWICLPILSAMFAGCATSIDENSTSGPTTSLQGTTGPAAILNPSNGTVAGLELDGCTVGTATFDFPKGMVTFPRPDGWDDSGSPILSLLVHPFLCKRVGWGPFERADVVLLFETHSAASFPPDCKFEKADTRAERILARLWLSDADLVEYGSQAFGIPTRLANMTLEGPGGLSARMATFTFTGSGGDGSGALLWESGGETHPKADDVLWLAWQVGENIGMMEIREAYFGDAIPSPLVIGEPAPGWILAKVADSRAMGIGGYFPMAHVETSLRLMEGLDCAGP